MSDGMPIAVHLLMPASHPHCVYILRSIANPRRFYTGLRSNLDLRPRTREGVRGQSHVVLVPGTSDRRPAGMQTR